MSRQMTMDIHWIREQLERGNCQVKLYALERASIRRIYPVDIKNALLNGEVIEEYPEDPRGSSCLVFGRGQEGCDIHMVCGMAYDMLWIITVYEPDPEEWSDPRQRISRVSESPWNFFIALLLCGACAVPMKSHEAPEGRTISWQQIGPGQ